MCESVVESTMRGRFGVPTEVCRANRIVPLIQKRQLSFACANYSMSRGAVSSELNFGEVQCQEQLQTYSEGQSSLKIAARPAFVAMGPNAAPPSAVCLWLGTRTCISSAFRELFLTGMLTRWLEQGSRESLKMTAGRSLDSAPTVDSDPTESAHR